ncbi:MAG: hypothetical protein QOJ39_3927 [Candidatus Eremiobacteraeota bacterium]|jgi:hypothetical protein|nr:hypothetical protein [Candidatus Eremiobacteraeota bacterium]MEA2722063.1 hypothetical protein [Candidatus Eremiobacteraeota bacterium]
MSPLFSVDLESKAAYLSYQPSAHIARQVKVVRGRTGRLGAIPFGLAHHGTSHVIAEFDAAGDVVGVQIEGICAETLGLADEFLGLLDLSLPPQLARTILG